MPAKITAAVLLIFLRLAVAAQQTTEAQIFFITVKTTDNKTLIQTGFKAKGYDGIITMLHGITSARSVSAFNEQNIVYNGLSITMVDIANDVALLSNSSLSNSAASGLDVLPNHEFVQRTEYPVMGHPVGIALYKSFVKVGEEPFKILQDLVPPGDFASELGSRKSPALGIRVVNLNGQVVSGQSGSPVMTRDQQVVAIIDGGLLNGSAGISWAIPISNLHFTPVASKRNELQALASLAVSKLFYSTGYETKEAFITVAQDGTGDYLRISDAIQHASENDIIKIKPGWYLEQIDIESKGIILLGDGPHGEIIIQGGFKSNTHFRTHFIKMMNLRFLNASLSLEGDGQYALYDCEIESNKAVDLSAQAFLKNVNLSGHNLSGPDNNIGMIINHEGVIIEDSKFSNCETAAIHCIWSDATINNCQFIENDYSLIVHCMATVYVNHSRFVQERSDPFKLEICYESPAYEESEKHVGKVIVKN